MKELLFKVEETEDAFIATCHEPKMAAQARSLEELLTTIRKMIDSRNEPRTPREETGE